MAFDWKKLVAVTAPSLATALGGPLAGMAVRAISGAILGRDDATETEVEQAMLSATPEQLLALKKADQEFLVRMRELEIDLERVGLQDRASARRMQVETRSWLPPLLALLVTAGYFGVLAVMLRWGLPKDAGGYEALLLLLGALSGGWTTIMAFYFGSSSSSRSKDATIQAATKNGR